MSNLQYRQSKIQEKRKLTPFRDFLMEICSWMPVVFHRSSYGVSRFAEHGRYRDNIYAYDDYVSKEAIEHDLDLSLPFMNQFHELFKVSPKLGNLAFGTNENCQYAESVFGAKNAYLSTEVGINSENVLYSGFVYFNCTNIYNSLQITNNSQNIYQCKSVGTSYNIFFSKYIDGSSDIWYSSNLVGCKECINCNDLQNQSFCIENRQLSKEEYFNIKSQVIYKLHQLHFETSNKSTNINSVNISGNGLYNCHDIENGFLLKNIDQGRNIVLADGGDKGSSHFYDSMHVGIDSDHFYANAGAGCDISDAYCCTQLNYGSNLYYCYFCESCSFCLGCIGLKNKSYCILNKQYTKEEWYQKVDEIFAQMEADGTLGQFFPASMNPFYFNDTAAYLIDPSFTKEEATAAGYLWRDEPIKVDVPEGAEIVKVEDLNKYEGFDEQGNWSINKEILKKIIQDPEGNVYRIVPMEYEFLIKYGLPLPRKHWLDRMKENFRIN